LVTNSMSGMKTKQKNKIVFCLDPKFFEHIFSTFQHFKIRGRVFSKQENDAKCEARNIGSLNFIEVLSIYVFIFKSQWCYFW
jgi:hypothetical protein